MTLAEKLSALTWGGPSYPSYDGMLKGDHSSQEQQAADQQRTLETQLMQQQLGMFQKQLNSVNSTLDPMIAQGGMPQAERSALTSLALNDLPQQFRSMEGGLNNQLVARGMTGGDMAGAGGVAKGFGELGALQSGLQQQAMSQIPIQAQQQLMQELGMKLGIGSQFGGMTGNFNQGMGNSLGMGVQAANNADQASTAFWGSLFGGLGALGSGWATGGFKH